MYPRPSAHSAVAVEALPGCIVGRISTKAPARKMTQMKKLRFVLAAVALLNVPLLAQAPTHGRRPARLIIRNATIVDGSGAPASGPADIVVEGTTISDVVWLDPVAMREGRARRPAIGAGVEIDATNKFVLPGLINGHGHVQDERGGVPQPLEYNLKLWLASGITTVREVGHDSTRKLIALRDRIARGEVAGPRLFAYMRFHEGGTPRTPEAARLRVQEIKRLGADGIKMTGLPRDVMQAGLEEAKRMGLRVAHHSGVEETNAWDDIRFGTTSIEHWYGVPDAAILDGRQNFPGDYNYRDETDRFRWAGRLWREADSARLSMVLDSMIASNVAWVPTLVIYEASRDLQRAVTQPLFADYLHPTLERYFRPDPAHHGSYFIGWTSTDEAFWKENYRIWMRALREFSRKGGLIGAGEDAGFIYQIYGAALIRELELHQEAGFHPLTIIKHATVNNARILGEDRRLGRVRAGWTADLLVVDGNPLENLKVLYPGGIADLRDGKEVRTNGVEWTIANGTPYHGPTLMGEVKELVRRARSGSN